MALTIISRPELNVNSFNSRWNAAGGNLPVKYGISTNLFPFPSTGSKTWTLDSNIGGYATLVNLVTPHGLAVGQWIYIASGAYAGISQVIRVISTFSFTIDRPGEGTLGGTYFQYYNNYKINVNVYLDGVLSGTKAYTPTGFNSTVDISDLLKTNLDQDRVKEFYITVFETYELIKGVPVTGSTVSDAANVFYAVYASLPFGNAFGGNMYEYVIGNNRQAKWMTDFERPVYFPSAPEWSVSIISDSGSFSLDFDQYDINGILITTDTVNYSASPGIFDVDFSSITLDQYTATVEISGIGVETLTVEIDGSTCN